MSSIALGSRTLGPGIGDRPARVGVGADRAGTSGLAAVAKMRPVDGFGRRDGAATFGRILAATIVVYAFLIVLPFLALAPFLVMGVFLGVIATLFGGTIGI